MTDETKCHCGGELGEIQIVDKTSPGGGGHQNLEYTVPEAKRSFWTQSYPVVGEVAALMCQSCGRIALFGRTGRT
ncbi:MAG: hypothetical protein ABGZ53_19600 [Fuerstiella sp.]|nr:hypothetical protein [Fuerstiella sp.]